MTPSPSEIAYQNVFASSKQHFLDTGDIDTCIKILNDGRPDRIWSREYSIFGTLANYGTNAVCYQNALMTIPLKKRSFYT
eukprot:UN08305